MQSKVDLFKKEWKVKRKKNVIRPKKYFPPKKLLLLLYTLNIEENAICVISISCCIH